MPTLRPYLPAALSLFACTPGPTDPDHPMPPISTPERVARPVRPADARAWLADVHRVPFCRPCPDRGRDGCAHARATSVCFAECRDSGLLVWDLGQPRACEAAARDHCVAEGLGPLESACWGGYADAPT